MTCDIGLLYILITGLLLITFHLNNTHTASDPSVSASSIPFSKPHIPWRVPDILKVVGTPWSITPANAGFLRHVPIIRLAALTRQDIYIWLLRLREGAQMMLMGAWESHVSEITCSCIIEECDNRHYNNICNTLATLWGSSRIIWRLITLRRKRQAIISWKVYEKKIGTAIGRREGSVPNHLDHQENCVNCVEGMASFGRTLVLLRHSNYQAQAGLPVRVTADYKRKLSHLWALVCKLCQQEQCHAHQHYII